MSLKSYAGILNGLRHRLSTEMVEYLNDEIKRYQEYDTGLLVEDAGKRIYSSVKADTYATDSFGERLKDTYTNILHGNINYDEMCCDHHRAVYKSLRSAVSDRRHKWLDTFIGIAKFIDHTNEFIGVYRSDLLDENITYSHFMPVASFVKYHLDVTFGDDSGVVEMLARQFDTDFDNATRIMHATEIGKRYGYKGKIGGFEITDNEWCYRGPVYSTIKRSIKSNRQGSPDDVLKQLGLTFSADEFWLEVNFEVDSAVIKQKPDGLNSSVAVPTILEGGHNWPYIPEREPHKHGWCKDLNNDTLGLPEIIHEPFSFSRINDIIVWQEPTQEHWFTDTVFEASRSRA